MRKIASAAEADEWRLPHWDWADENVAGLPDLFTVATYVDLETNETKPNPLLSQPYQFEWAPGDPVLTPWPTTTYRNPGAGPVKALKSLGKMVENALREPTFTCFSPTLEQPHNSLHVWVMGYMATFRSAFDPIFWVHHATQASIRMLETFLVSRSNSMTSRPVPFLK
ncbi:MAG: tyrosinase family protein [Cyanobacteria bacterium K_Offshore_surface_m2_239]|nr:tyrosinase family protein [Cyanobacteria bacterium K_Offshore_surface_m2_239]